MDSQTRMLVDIEAIRAFKATYGMEVDGLIRSYTPEKLAGFGDLFTDDVEVCFGKAAGQGRQFLLDFIGNTVRSKRSWLWHSFQTPLIRIDGDTATGDWTVHCMALSKGAAQLDAMYGRYKDRYVRTPKGWRQSSLTFVNETPECH